MKILKPFAVCALVALMAVACSSDDSSTSQAKSKLPAQKTSLGVTAAAKVVSDGLLAGDAGAIYSQLSQECKEDVTEKKLDGQLTTGRAYLKSFIGADLNDFSVGKIETQKVVEGKTAQARYSLEVQGESGEALQGYLQRNASTTSSTTKDDASFVSQPTPWFDFIYEEGAWRLNDCGDFLSQSSLTGAGAQ